MEHGTLNDAEAKDVTTEAEIDAALEAAKTQPEWPRALSAQYKRDSDVIEIRIDNGRRLTIPREEMQGLRDATEEQISDIQIFGPNDIAWPQLDLDHNLYSLMEGRYGSDKWMESLQKKPIAA